VTLKQYHQKRRFTRTPEPRGRVAGAKGRSFVVQKHAASHLHYDFRLEHQGVLLSWACPKGPSLDPAEKRLAVHVEDHPVDYGGFEGTIPAGEYGGGTVMLWDRGTWQCDDSDPAAAYKKGHLRFMLNGEKLRGGWHLMRMHGRRSGDKENWLLMKAKDKFARPGDGEGVLTRNPKSVKTNRTMDEITAGRRVGRAAQKKPSPKRTAREARAVTAAAHAGRKQTSRAKHASRASPQKTSDDPPGRPARMPKHPAAQLATLVRRPPEGEGWVHELKFDGYRMLAIVRDGVARLISRNGQDWTSRMPAVAAAAAEIDAREAVLDGEVVVLDKHGISRFQLLQNALGRFRSRVATNAHYYVFDLLHLDGRDLKSLPLLERKAILRRILPRGSKKKRLLAFSDHVTGSGTAFFREACRAGLEGIISKRVDSPYEGSRAGTWVKSKCRHEQEFVVAGYTDPQGARSGFGSLLLGYFERTKFVYAGRVGTGFTDQTIKNLTPLLKRLEVKTAAFDRGAKESRGKGVHWVEPKLVAQIEFGNWTDDGLLRHPSFQGLRDDKPATQVKRERPRPR